MNDLDQVKDKLNTQGFESNNIDIPEYIVHLNDAQREAVQTIDGPVLVLAGAGTGKTRVLTTRLAHLLRLGKVRPYQILAVTFTNKAAREMRDRVAELVGGQAEEVWLGTFHALGARILRRHAELVGLKSNFSIIDTDDQVRLLKQLLEASNVDSKRWPARSMMGVIQRWKDRGLVPGKISESEVGDIAGGKLIQIYEEYQERLRTLNSADFGDLLLHCLSIFAEEKYKDILSQYQQRFKFILVDEYQDANVAQYLWLRLLAQGHKNIACVGDDDQSIYSWRGAEVGNILRFEEDFPGARIIRLEQNYRSTAPILAAASALISHNKGRLGKSLWTEGEGGEPIHVRGFWDSSEEARFVSDHIEDLQRRGLDGSKILLREMAVLVRASFQTRAFEERFLMSAIPYQVIGGARFYERLEIRDALAYLRVINQPDDDLAFERIINRPKRGIGDKTLQVLYTAARAEKISLYKASADIISTDELKPRTRSSLSNLLNDFARWRSTYNEDSESVSHTELAEIVLDESGYTGMLMIDKSPEAPGRLDNLKELITAMGEFENLGGFLEHVSLVMENTENPSADMVNIMTLHGAKGLEFKTVFLPGWEEGLFPHQRHIDESGEAGLEEERRLAYVGLTRAKNLAIVTFALNRQVHGQWKSSISSRFLEELPLDQIVVENELETTEFENLYEKSQRSNVGLLKNKVMSTSNLYKTESENINDRDAVSFLIDERVFHQKFGYGKIIEVEMNKLTIDFEKAGIKKVLDSFVISADSV